MTKSKNVDKVLEGVETTCVIHDHEFSHHCFKCKRLICDKCATGPHKIHEYETVAERARQIRDSHKKKQLKNLIQFHRLCQS